MNTKLTMVLAGLSFVSLLSACSQQSDKDKLMEAQFCLDQATSATAQSCVQPIANMQTTQSYALQCSAGFIQSGVSTPAKLAQALDSISTNNGASSSTTQLLSILNMGDVTLADNTATYCAKSGQVGFSLLGAMAKSATVIANTAANLSSCTDISTCDLSAIQSTINDLKNALDNNAGTTSNVSLADAQATVGAIAGSVQTVYASTCATGTANQDICGPINDALTAAHISDVTTLTQQQLIDLGTQLLSQWQP